MKKKVTFNLKINEIKEFEKEKVDYYEDYLSTIESYLSYDKEPNEDLKNKEMVLRNGKVKKIIKL